MNKSILYLFIATFLTGILLTTISPIYGLDTDDSSDIYFEQQNYLINLNKNNDSTISLFTTLKNNGKDARVFGYFTYYSNLPLKDVVLIINGEQADAKKLRVENSILTYEGLWEPLPSGQTLNIFLTHSVDFNPKGILFKEIEIIPGKFYFKDFSNISIKFATIAIQTPNKITYSNYPKFEINSADEYSVIWQDDGSNRQYIVEYSAIPFFKNHIVQGYFIFWVFLFLVAVGVFYMYEKKVRQKDFVGVDPFIEKSAAKKKKKNKPSK